MALEVWYNSDIQNALLAARRTLIACSKNGTVPATFQSGFLAALDTVALSFGLETRFQLDWHIVEGSVVKAE